MASPQTSSFVRGQARRTTTAAAANEPRPETSSLRINEVNGSAQIDIRNESLAQGPAFNHDEDTRPHFRILSLDGGGVKGIMPALQLEQLELELQAEVSRWQSGAEWRGEALEKMRKSVAAEVGREDLPSIDGDAKQLRIADFFDLAAGTSTGGLIAAFLTTRNPETQKIRPAGELVNFYKSLAKAIFPTEHYEARDKSLTWTHLFWGFFSSSYLYDVTPLETNLQAILGNTKAIDTVKPCVICTISFDSRMPQVWETGIPRPKVVNGEIDPASDRFGLKNTEMWRVCRATSAAPTYFKPAAITRRVAKRQAKPDNPAFGYETERYLDGGLFANDPVFFAFRWPFSNRDGAFKDLNLPKSFHPDLTNIMVLSLGCGEAQVAADPAVVDPSNWSIKDWMTNSPDLVSRGMSGTGHAPNMAFFFPYVTAKCMPYYLRMQPKIPGDLAPMDKAASLDRLEAQAQDYLFKQCGHRGYPTGASYPEEADGEPREPLTGHLAESYTGDAANQAFVLDSLVKETNGQTLARFAQLLAREWVLRRLHGANFGVNVQDLNPN